MKKLPKSLDSDQNIAGRREAPRFSPKGKLLGGIHEFILVKWNSAPETMSLSENNEVELALDAQIEHFCATSRFFNKVRAEGGKRSLFR
jgi:hypothetical protein